jgi:sugar lactone lactonase YvrE
MARSTGESEWRVIEELRTGNLLWGESPRSRDGELWVSDTQGSKLVVVGPNGAGPRVIELESPVNGTWFLPTGDLVAARMSETRVDKFDGETWATYSDVTELSRTGRLGDLIALPDGTVFVDDVTHGEPGQLLRIDTDGKGSVAADDLTFPNGLAVIDDGRTLVVAETFAGRLSAFTLTPDRRLEDRRVMIDLQSELGPDFLPDGICACADGSVWVATTRGSALVRVVGGSVEEQIELDGFVIACCLSADESDLYVTVAQSLDPGVEVIDAVYKRRTRARVFKLGRENH